MKWRKLTHGWLKRWEGSGATRQEAKSWTVADRIGDLLDANQELRAGIDDRDAEIRRLKVDFQHHLIVCPNRKLHRELARMKERLVGKWTIAVDVVPVAGSEKPIQEGIMWGEFEPRDVLELPMVTKELAEFFANSLLPLEEGLRDDLLCLSAELDYLIGSDKESDG
jgi:hypothetical protein